MDLNVKMQTIWSTLAKIAKKLEINFEIRQKLRSIF